MIIDLFLLIVFIVVLILLSLALFSGGNNLFERVAPIIFIIVLIIVFPIQYEKDVLFEYEFSAFREAGRIDYVSPFTKEKKSDMNIENLALYNDMKEHMDIRMEKYYSVIGISLGEKFVID